MLPHTQTNNQVASSSHTFQPITHPTPQVPVPPTQQNFQPPHTSTSSSPIAKPHPSHESENIQISSPSSESPIPINTHPMLTRAKNNITKPKLFLDGSTKYSSPHALMVDSALNITKPIYYTQASMDPHWRTAMNSEFDALLQSNTWCLVPISTAKNLVGCKWVFHIKKKADGSVDRYKARLVAKGFH